MVPAIFMDRSKTNKFKNAANFIKFVVQPLYDTMQKFLPASHLCHETLMSNLKRLEALDLKHDVRQHEGGS